MKKLQKIKKNNPDVDQNENLVQLAEEFDKLHDIKALADTPGGARLAELLVIDVVNNVNKLAYNYSSLSLSELQAICAALNANLGLAKLITKSKENLGHLDEMIAEQLTNQ